jgi:hypothetical protein
LRLWRAVSLGSGPALVIFSRCCISQANRVAKTSLKGPAPAAAVVAARLVRLEPCRSPAVLLWLAILLPLMMARMARPVNGTASSHMRL